MIGVQDNHTEQQRDKKYNNKHFNDSNTSEIEVRINIKYHRSHKHIEQNG